MAGLRLSRADTCDVENLGGWLTQMAAPRGRLMMALDFAIRLGTIGAIGAIADPARLAELDLAVLDG